MEREYISYIHDGSDTLKDNFTIVANQTEIRKNSLPCTVHISVTPVNDETPVVTTNRGLKVGNLLLDRIKERGSASKCSLSFLLFRCGLAQ